MHNFFFLNYDNYLAYKYIDYNIVKLYYTILNNININILSEVLFVKRNSINNTFIY